MTEASDIDRWRTPEYLDGEWSGRVAYSDKGGGYAYRPRQVIVAESVIAPAIAGGITHRAGGPAVEADHFERLCDADVFDYHILSHPELDVEWILPWLEDLGLAEPNYVLFADGLPDAEGGGVGANPIYGNPIYGNPIYGNPIYGNPIYGNPIYGNPIYGNGPFASPVHARPDWGTPVYMSPLYADRYHAPTYRETGRIPTGARPVDGANVRPTRPPNEGPLTPNVIVFDTGLAPKKTRPCLLDHLGADPSDIDRPDANNDGVFDPVAGHGTFIAGVIEQLVPGVSITSKRVLSSFGDGDVGNLLCRIACMLDCVGPHTIVNMSFSGYSNQDIRTLDHAVRLIRDKGAVVVASAGNDGIGRPSYPASLRDVVGVGGVQPSGPAAFSNWGPWLRACAPAVDLSSSFYVHPTTTKKSKKNKKSKRIPLRNPQPPMSGMPDAPVDFAGWARWTGTSFAAPIVVAAIAREMLRLEQARLPHRADDAVAAVIDAPDLVRIPNLGTVINLSPPLPPRLPQPLQPERPRHS